MVIFHSYVKLPEGTWNCDPLPHLEEYFADINKPTCCVCFLATQGQPWKKKDINYAGHIMRIQPSPNGEDSLLINQTLIYQ